MTLEEAKKKIKAQANAEWEEFKKTGSMLCQGFALGADDALETLDKVESSGNPEQLTLKELANELRKIFRFKYLTAESVTGKIVALWDDKPFFTGYEWHFTDEGQCVADIRFHRVPVLDLSEYIGENGEIDFSKCIVEVE